MYAAYIQTRAARLQARAYSLLCLRPARTWRPGPTPRLRRHRSAPYLEARQRQRPLILEQLTAGRLRPAAHGERESREARRIEVARVRRGSRRRHVGACGASTPSGRLSACEARAEPAASTPPPPTALKARSARSPRGAPWPPLSLARKQQADFKFRSRGAGGPGARARASFRSESGAPLAILRHPSSLSLSPLRDPPTGIRAACMVWYGMRWCPS
jgi:hypothetical protein